VRDFLRGLTGDLRLKGLALAIALAVWAGAVLERSYSTTFRVPVFVSRSGDSLRVVTDVDVKSAVVMVEGKGKDLLRLRFKDMRFRPEIPEGRSGTKQVRLSDQDLGLPASLTVRSINPEYVEVTLSPTSRRALTISIPVKGRAAEGLTVLGLRPVTSVRVAGPAEEVGLLAGLSTETLDLATVTRAGVLRLRVPPPEEGYLVTPESVDVEVTLEREVARILLDVPVKVIAPASMTVEVAPEVAQVAIAGPASRIDSLRASDVTLNIKIASLQPGEHRLAAEVSSLPRGFRLVKCEPQLFDVNIR
jgi:YbbR domain-containing protein